MRPPFSKCPSPLLVSLVLLLSIAPAVFGAEIEPSVEIAPQSVKVGSFYHGTELMCKGTVPAACKVALVVAGEEKEHSLNQKGKVGPLWMNVGTVTIEGVPELYYLLTSTGQAAELAPPEILLANGVGYDVLRQSARIEPQGSANGDTFQEFVKLKEHMGLYETLSGSIKLNSAQDGSAGFTVPVSIPSLVPAGEYKVVMYCFGEDQSVSSVSTAFTVEKVGLPEKLSVLAFDHGALYGILSIAVAIAAGVVMGLLFGSKSKGGH
jgi:uncharacterized protein (TIGR02186 family)